MAKQKNRNKKKSPDITPNFTDTEEMLTYMGFIRPKSSIRDVLFIKTVEKQIGRSLTEEELEENIVQTKNSYGMIRTRKIPTYTYPDQLYQKNNKFKPDISRKELGALDENKSDLLLPEPHDWTLKKGA